MEVIEFDNDNKNKVKNQKLFPIIIGLVVILVIAQSIRYYNNWTKNIELLEKAIENKEINADSLYTILESKLIKIDNIKKYHKGVKNIFFKNELKKIGESFSIYTYPFFNNDWNDEQLDSILTTLTAIKDLEAQYKNLIEPENQLLVQVYKLKGLEKLIFDKVDSKNYKLDLEGHKKEDNIETKTEVFLFEQEVRNILKQQDSIRNLTFLQKNINPEEYQLETEDFVLDAITQSYYFEFLFDPSKKNLENMVNRTQINDSDFSLFFRTVLYRVMNSWNPRVAHIETKNPRDIDRYALSVLKYYASDCYDCTFNEYLFLYYFNTANVDVGLFTMKMADLEFDKLEVERAFRNALRFDDEKKSYWDEYLHILYKYALFLDSTDINELLKFRNSLRFRLEKHGFNVEKIDKLDFQAKGDIAAIYYLDSRIRFDKNDYGEAVKDFQEIDYLLNLTEDESDTDYIRHDVLAFLMQQRSPLFAKWWYSEGILNQDFKASCQLLKRAYELNPKDYYDIYLKECL